MHGCKRSFPCADVHRWRTQGCQSTSIKWETLRHALDSGRPPPFGIKWWLELWVQQGFLAYDRAMVHRQLTHPYMPAHTCVLLGCARELLFEDDCGAYWVSSRQECGASRLLVH